MIDKNLKYLRQKNKISQQHLADAMDLPRTTLGDYERGKTEPNISMLIRLSEFFDVKVDDLISRNLSHDDLEIVRNKDFRVLAISVDSSDRENIELVDTKAEAGYLDAYHNPEYIRDLPKIHFPNLPAGTFRGFEIRGDSMLPMEPGSIVISRYVERLDDVKHEKTYIVVSKSEGLVYKRVRVDRPQKKLILISDNELYLPYTLDFEEIDELWEYFAHLSFSDAKRSSSSLIEEKLNDIQLKVTALTNEVLDS